MRRANAILLSVAMLALFAGLWSCDNSTLAGGAAGQGQKPETPPTPPSPEDAESESKTSADSQGVLSDWPPVEQQEDSVLSAGLLGQVLGKAPPTLNVADALIQPGQTARIVIKLGRGFGRATVKSYPAVKVSITDAGGNEVFSERTDQGGRMTFERKFRKAGNYFFRARVEKKIDDKTVTPVLFCVYVRPKESALVICDLDRTLVQSGFERVLAGLARPFDHAGDVLWRLVKERQMTVIYLTQRPDFFDASSRMWLRRNEFPPGPLFTSDLKGLIGGSGSFKAGQIARLKQKFPNLRLAIGDKYSDIAAYAENKVPSILIPHIKWSKDKRKYWQKLLRNMKGIRGDVPVCRNWFEIEEAIFKKTRFPPSRMIDKIKEMIRTTIPDD
ncbi:MAG: hypothetical protein GWP05_07830 [Anaerolineaceae bacterium]|nr:hypothetical protein [Anaerolineaceae bacterium]